MPLKTPIKGKFTDPPQKTLLKKKNTWEKKKKKKPNKTKQNKNKKQKNKKTKKQNKTKKTQQQQLAFYSWYHCLDKAMISRIKC